MNEITPANIREWQNILIGKGYEPTYLKTINNQLTAIFNHAMNLYGLQESVWSQKLHFLPLLKKYSIIVRHKSCSIQNALEKDKGLCYN